MTTTPPRITPSEQFRGLATIRNGTKHDLGYDVDAAGTGVYLVTPRGMGGARRAAKFPLTDEGWTAAWEAFAKAEPGAAENYLTGLQRAAAAAASGQGPVQPRHAPAVPLLTLPDYPGFQVESIVGFVTAHSVMSRNVLSDIGSDVRSTFGGNLGGIEQAIATAITQTKQRLYERVAELRGDAVLGVKLDLLTVSDKAQAIVISGTCVRVAPTRPRDKTPSEH